MNIYQHIIATLASVILLTSFLLLVVKNHKRLITVYALQSLCLAIATFCDAQITSDQQLYFSAFLTFILKVVVITWLLRFLIKKLKISQQQNIPYNFWLLLFASGLVIFCYHLVHNLTNFSSPIMQSSLVVALATTLFGMLIMIIRHDALTHVIGFMAMENGLFFGAITTTNGMPMIVELGVAFDVLIAIILFGVLFFHISSSIDSLDIDRLNRLREDK